MLVRNGLADLAYKAWSGDKSCYVVASIHSDSTRLPGELLRYALCSRVVMETLDRKMKKRLAV